MNAEFKTQKTDDPSLGGHIQRILLDLQEYYEPVTSYKKLWDIKIENLRKVKKIIVSSKATSTAGKRANFNKAMGIAYLEAQRLKNELLEMSTIRQKPSRN